jgi:hypothetical protein
VFFQRLDRGAITSQTNCRLLRTVLVGCICAAATIVAGGVGETSSAPRSAPEATSRTNWPASLALSAEPRVVVKTKKPSVNVGSATQVESEATVVIESSADAAIAEQALSSLSVDWRALAGGWTIDFKGERAGYLGLTLVREKRVEIYMRRGRSAEGVAHDLGHELGHVVDVTFGSDESRAEYLRIRRLKPTTPWWTCAGCTDLQVGAGDFAETFAALVGPRFKFYSELKAKPSTAQLQEIQDALPTQVQRRLL